MVALVGKLSNSMVMRTIYTSGGGKEVEPISEVSTGKFSQTPLSPQAGRRSPGAPVTQLSYALMY